MISPYDVLGVPRDAELAAIKKAWRTLSGKYHPDIPQTGNRARFDEVTAAYDTLRDPVKRAAYDSAGGLPPVEVELPTSPEIALELLNRLAKDPKGAAVGAVKKKWGEKPARLFGALWDVLAEDK